MRRALIFDFDGVILESVEIKNQAMAEIFADEARHIPAILALNERLGGISRVVKFQEIYRTILGRSATAGQLEAHAERFQELVFDKVVNCPWVPGALEFLKKHAATLRMFVLSGTPDLELQQVVDARDLRRYFVEVHGSPPGKPEAVKDIVARHGLALDDVILIGDAPLDQEAAVAAGIGFVGRVPPGQPSPFVPGTRTIADLNGLHAALAV